MDNAHSEPIISFRDVSKVFFAKGNPLPNLAIEGVDLDVHPGEFVCIIGPSGCGKSTLLNLVAGLMKPTVGTVMYRGSPVGGINSRTGYITQGDNLLPWRTLRKNVALPLEIQGTPRGQIRERVDEVLSLVGLTGYHNHYPGQLSGGMRKRATLARTLIYGPETLLMDEPFGALDAQLRLRMQAELLTMWERDSKVVLFVTHDLEEAIILGDRVVVFGRSPGNIIHVEHIGLPRPRDVVSMRTSPEFRELWSRLWNLLDSQVEVEGVAR